MLNNTGKKKSLSPFNALKLKKAAYTAIATLTLSMFSYSAFAADAPTYALVQINQQALFFNLMNKGAQEEATKSGAEISYFQRQ
ncbi:ABC-type sugar transport system substrate-binding protein [Ewingella americana]